MSKSICDNHNMSKSICDNHNMSKSYNNRKSIRYTTTWVSLAVTAIKWVCLYVCDNHNMSKSICDNHNMSESIFDNHNMSKSIYDNHNISKSICDNHNMSKSICDNCNINMLALNTDTASQNQLLATTTWVTKTYENNIMSKSSPNNRSMIE